MENLPTHWSILGFDVEGFSESYRDDRARIGVRAGFYRVLQDSFLATALPWSASPHEDRGDGAIVLVPPRVSKVLLLDPFLGCLSAALAEHNRSAPLPERFRLRCAVHAGEVSRDDHGMSGTDLVTACRMLDAVELRTSLRHAAVDVVAIVSDGIYQAIVRHGYRDIDPATYHPVSIEVKRSRFHAWIHLPGTPVPPVVAGPTVGTLRRPG